MVDVTPTDFLCALRDLLFPAFCRSCWDPCGSGVFCDSCSADIEWLGRCCPRCAMPYPGAAGDVPCSACRTRRLSFDGVLACAVYAGPLRRAVLRLKNRRDPELLGHCAEILRSKWCEGGASSEAIEAASPAVVVPVPAHRLRDWVRGWNPALELAREFAARAGLQFRQALSRRRFICPQSALPRSLRRRNQLDSLRVRHRREVPEVALLVDDVVTTGATADAAARTLKRAGTRRVHVLALARSV